MHLDLPPSELLELDRTRARPLFEQLGGADGQHLDLCAEMLERLAAQDRPRRVGVVGESQVGKSSILNAIAGRRVLPAGGVGPLTVQATTLRHGTEEFARVRYHDRARLNELRFALESRLRHQGRLGALALEAEVVPGEPERPLEDAAPVDRAALDATVADAQVAEQAAIAGTPPAPLAPAGDASASQQTGAPESTPADPASAADERQLTSELSAAARLLFNVPDEYPEVDLLQLVRAAAAKDEPTDLLPADEQLRARLAEIRARLGTEERLERVGLGATGFKRELRLRAAGWMAPLVAELEVALDLPLLRSVELVDLPGVGVLADPAGRRAEEFVRKSADALIIVMRNNGLTSEVAGLLERTGVITRLLWTGAEDPNPMHVVIAVTHLDSVAKERWQQLALEARDRDETPPPREDVFHGLAEEMAARIRRQLASALRGSRDSEDLAPEQAMRREAVIERLCAEMTIACVCAPDHLTLLDGFNDSFLPSAEATRIPALSARLAELGHHARTQWQGRLEEARRALHVGLAVALRESEQRFSDARRQASEAVERFRGELEELSRPLREEARTAREAAAKTLRQTVEEQVGRLASLAATRALRRVEKLRALGVGINYRTLNAALVRGGAFEGSVRVDYPDELTRAFVDGVASRFEPHLLEEVRTQLDKARRRDADFLERFVAEARKVVDDPALRDLLSQQRKLLQAQARSSLQWTQAQMEELKESVRVGLAEAIASPIEKACEAAKKAGENCGTGARLRILTTFDTGSRRAIALAEKQCAKLLSDQFDSLASGVIRMHLDSTNPVQAALDRVVDAGASRIAQARAEAGRALVGQVRALRSRLGGDGADPQAQAANEQGPQPAVQESAEPGDADNSLRPAAVAVRPSSSVTGSSSTVTSSSTPTSENDDLEALPPLPVRADGNARSLGFDLLGK